VNIDNVSEFSQEKSINTTQTRLKSSLREEQMKRIILELRSHESFPEYIVDGSVSAILYNLGYLPGSDKTVTTKDFTTLSSIKASLKLIAPRGMISLLCYRGNNDIATC
jgi:hypothetical protein